MPAERVMVKKAYLKEGRFLIDELANLINLKTIIWR